MSAAEPRAAGPGIADAVVVLGGRRVDAAAYHHAQGVAPVRGAMSVHAADADEDVVTLALDALRRLVDRRDLDAVGQLVLVGPFDVGDAALFTEALNRPELAVSIQPGGPATAADALLMVLNGPAEPATLVVAADDGRSGGASAGAGAVALWLDEEGPVRLEWEVHRRHAGKDAGPEALDRLLKETQDDGSAPIAVAEPAPGVGRRILGRQARRGVAHQVAKTGHLGAAAPLVALVEGFADPRVEAGLLWYVPVPGGAVTARFGGRLSPTVGMEDALAAPVIDSDAAIAVAARHAWDGAGSRVAQGAHVSRAAFLQEAPARLRWQGQRCSACDAVVFPPRESCPSCADSGLDPMSLRGNGQIHARTRIAAGGGPTEFDPLQQAVGGYSVAIVTLEEGPRVAAMLSGPGNETLAIGDPVTLAVRLLYMQDGMRRYGFKALRALHRDD